MSDSKEQEFVQDVAENDNVMLSNAEFIEKCESEKSASTANFDERASASECAQALCGASEKSLGETVATDETPAQDSAKTEIDATACETEIVVASANDANGAPDDANKYDIKNFDNPYELLLAIMDDNKVDLKTVVLSEITDEYLEYIRQSDSIDLEQASEFLAVAATLLEIKVKALLPKPEEPKEDEVDPEKELLRKIEEYKIMKEAAVELQKIEDIDRFYKDPDESVNDFRYVLKQMNMDNLLNAFTKMMIKLQQKTTVSVERKIEKDRFTVAEKIFTLKVVLNEKQQVHFSEMFDSDYSKSEIISTFQAMLELMKLQFIKVTQANLFEDILIIKNPDYVEGQATEKIDEYEE